MIQVGHKYHKSGKIYTVVKLYNYRTRCSNSKVVLVSIDLEDSCGHITNVSPSQLTSNYSGLPSNLTINNQSLKTND